MSVMPGHFMFFSGLSFILLIIYIVIAMVSFVLFVKLALRGIKALDIYIAKNKDVNSRNDETKDN